MESTGWQDMRQQLFGQQRAREAESRLIRALGEIHARVSAATQGAHAPALASPKLRARTLEAIVEGANHLIVWHSDELLAGHTAGRSATPLPDTAQEALAAAQAVSALFDGAAVNGGVIDCADVIHSIASLAGPESDAFFNDALAGATATLTVAFEGIASDPMTALAAAPLGDTWDALMADVASLALPLPEPSSEVGEEVEPPQPLPTRDLIGRPAPERPLAGAAERAAEAFERFEAAEELPVQPTLDIIPADVVPADVSPAFEVQPDLSAAPDQRRYSVDKSTTAFEVQPDLSAAQPTPVTPILAARFGRIQLVAC
jgi:hypothetical protein